jgi:hypothetical protein
MSNIKPFEQSLEEGRNLELDCMNEAVIYGWATLGIEPNRLSQHRTNSNVPVLASNDNETVAPDVEIMKDGIKMYHEVKMKRLYAGCYLFDCHRYDYLIDFYVKSRGINTCTFLTIFNPNREEWLTVSAYKLSKLGFDQSLEPTRFNRRCPVYHLPPEIFTPLEDVLSGNYVTVTETHLETKEGELI